MGIKSDDDIRIYHVINQYECDIKNCEKVERNVEILVYIINIRESRKHH